MKFLIPFIMVAFMLTACDQKNEAADTADGAKDMPKPEKYKDKYSYSLGYQVGNQITQDSLELALDYYIKGLKDAMSGDTSRVLLSPEEFRATMEKFQKEMMEKQQAKMKRQKEEMEKQGKENVTKSKEFMAQNKNKQGVVTTATGLQYKVLKKGSGQSPTKNDIVEVHLVGKYIDGKEFDNTYKDNRQPPRIQISRSIPGWQEALTKMKVGSKWRLFVPPALAYGEQGAPPTIPPNSALIFDVELLDIVTEEAMKEQREQMMKQQQMQQRQQGGR
jgi:FKBP-type peptidyl-prolyl cis-trans isomerase